MSHAHCLCCLLVHSWCCVQHSTQFCSIIRHIALAGKPLFNIDRFLRGFRFHVADCCILTGFVALQLRTLDLSTCCMQADLCLLLSVTQQLWSCSPHVTNIVSLADANLPVIDLQAPLHPEAGGPKHEHKCNSIFMSMAFLSVQPLLTLVFSLSRLAASRQASVPPLRHLQAGAAGSKASKCPRACTGCL